MRGKPLFYRHGEPIGGLIPACAGKTIFNVSSAIKVGAHPRVCGENMARMLCSRCVSGSSPRVRGKRELKAFEPAAARLIPACAGKTPRQLPDESQARAHPRVCGENKIRESARFRVAGSSPRVRGKQLVYVLNALWEGLIPACAGKTLNDLEF